MTQQSIKPQLPPGRYIQIYLDAVKGNHSARMASMSTALDRFKAVGVKGILFHHASYEWHSPGAMTPESFKELAALCTGRDLLALAAFGMLAEDPEGMGRKVGAIANLPECFAVVFDMEGAWEVKEGRDKAKRLGKAFRAVSRLALAFDQPWPVPTLHSNFPFEETASFVDVRSAQWYFNDFIKRYGTDRYSKCMQWFGDSWKVLDAKLAKKGLVRPEIKTIQGYKWDDIFSDLIHCLTSNPTLFIWSEPYPDESFMKALAVVQKLEQLGFSGEKAVENYQASKQGSLVVNNVCGPETLQSLGF